MDAKGFCMTFGNPQCIVKNGDRTIVTETFAKVLLTQWAYKDEPRRLLGPASHFLVYDMRDLLM